MFNVTDMLPWFANDKFPLYLAPMAGFTDIVFRQLCKEHGADVMVTEFVMSDGLLREAAKVWEMVDFTHEQRPMGVQLFGSNPINMAEAARRVVDRMNPDFVDINYGCPSPKVCAVSAGSSLLRDLPLLGKIAEAVVKAVPGTPVTAKIRIGWDDQNVVAPEAGHILEAQGIQALAVHGRTRMQEYRGEANWEVIAQVAERLRIPVIGNGSVRSATDVLRVRSTSKVRGLMIGRAALGNPWIFNQIKHTLATGSPPPPVTMDERWTAMVRYAELLMDRPVRQQSGPSVTWMRQRLMAFVREFPGSRQLRRHLESANTLEDLRFLAAESRAGRLE
ncbi:MAG: tRNA dihydrouridine synthase DusB [Verrucomicrobiota bacterium]|nr:tRNA dihydrouridine synthase DusB [Verrucomicrobiota bacterium]